MFNVALLQYTVPGIPSIYYGSEFGIEGDKNRDSDWNLRPDLNLADFNEMDELPHLFTKLGKLKQRFPELTYGEYQELFLTTRQFAFARVLDGKAVVTALNNDDNPAHMEINLPVGASQAINLLTVEEEETDKDAANDALIAHRTDIKNGLIEKSGELIGAASEISFKANDIKVAVEAFDVNEGEIGATVNPALGALRGAIDNMNRVYEEFCKKSGVSMNLSQDIGDLSGEHLELRDGRLIVDLPPNRGIVVYLS
jgi:hypothetical protein